MLDIVFCRYQHIRPICLPDPRGFEDIKDGIAATVAGWGLQGGKKGQSVLLKKTKLEIVSMRRCSQAYGKRRLRETHLCAYAEGN